MDRADVIILGGGLVGLALAAALDSSGLSVDRRRSGRSRQRAGRRVRRPHQRASPRHRGGCSTRSASAIISRSPAARSAGSEVADGLEPGGLAFDPGDDDEPLGWMHENRHLRAALRARAEARQEHLADVEGQAGRGRARRAWRHRARWRTAASSARRCWSPPRGAIRRRARRPGSASPAGNMTMARSSRPCATSGRTTMSPTKSSIRRARSRCCR